MKHSIEIQQIVKDEFIPSPGQIREWVACTLDNKLEKISEITIRIVDKEEITALNSQFRKKSGATNVLSFPFETPKGISEFEESNYLGDIVICATIVNQEAKDQKKAKEAHWAHMVVHGVFHLLGYDHQTESEANIMEALEIETMRVLGFANPYETGENIESHD